MVVVGGTCMRLRYLITKKVKEYTADEYYKKLRKELHGQ